MTVYVVTVGIGRREVCRSSSEVGAIVYAEAYARKYMENVSVHTDEAHPVFLVDVVDGQILVTDCDMQQAAWDQFIEEDDKT